MKSILKFVSTIVVSLLIQKEHLTCKVCHFVIAVYFRIAVFLVFCFFLAIS